MCWLEFQISKNLCSQTIVNLKQNMSAIILRSDKKLQESQKVGIKHSVQEEIEKERMRSQLQISPMKESSE